MSTLTERAAAAAGRVESPPQGVPAAAPAVEEYVPTLDPMAGYEPGDDDPEMVPVHLAWLRVRKEIRAIAKGEQYNGGGTRFNFRGVDTVVNTFGPVTLKHGINVLPIHVEASYRDTTTSKGSKMHECTATVTWQIIGPKGDHFTLQTQGEALDSADKATAKAQSVALRVLLLTSGLTPTHDKDPDASYVERGNDAPARSAESYRDEILDKKTSQSRLQQIGYELSNLRMLGQNVVNEVGEQETLDALGRRIYTERSGGAA
ncbi:ERF family protein [Streptomyces sp. NBC_00249]|uniref:ERF family protein n=1 Tax=Streptomyces sp. NBC_00249 TaxID=2975690 RepID=UPI0022563733|nr:ERF family protein [Streptomyces sp. NBC_00249]MCX5197185.1 ERF family protein [Streptomyces sp. NBC_00249]